MFLAVVVCFSSYLRIGSVGGGGVKRDWYTTYLCTFSAYTAQKSKFSKLISLILRSPKMTIQVI